MRKFLMAKSLYLALRLILGLLFLYAGASKLTDPGAFAIAIDGYGLVSWGMAKNLAYGLPVIEVVTGLGLVLDVCGALGMIVAQLLGFMGVLLYAISLGLDMDCGCFGPEDPSGTGSGSVWEALIRDIFMFGACLLIYWQRRAAGFVPRTFARILSFRKQATPK